MSCSNIADQKNRNIKDHLFVINAILNDASNEIDDLEIYDIMKCVDKLWRSQMIYMMLELQMINSY